MRTLLEFGRLELAVMPAVVFGIAYDGEGVHILLLCFLISIDTE